MGQFREQVCNWPCRQSVLSVSWQNGGGGEPVGSHRHPCESDASADALAASLWPLNGVGRSKPRMQSLHARRAVNSSWWQKNSSRDSASHIHCDAGATPAARSERSEGPVQWRQAATKSPGRHAAPLTVWAELRLRLLQVSFGWSFGHSGKVRAQSSGFTLAPQLESKPSDSPRKQHKSPIPSLLRYSPALPISHFASTAI
jgi:hypothetical protein